MTHFMFILKINNTTEVDKSVFTSHDFLHSRIEKIVGWTTCNMLIQTKINSTFKWPLMRWITIITFFFEYSCENKTEYLIKFDNNTF